MIIDFVTIILLALAIYKGWRKGLVIAICSVMGVFIGMIAALTFSAKLSGYFQAKGEHAFWMPFLVFAIIMAVTIFLIHILGNTIQKMLKTLHLGGLNRVGGILLFLFGYFSIYSIILFYASGISLISPSMISNSKTYAYIQPWGPKAVSVIGKFIPWFQNILGEIRAGFEKVK